ncbi:MAG: hypothetical protein PHF00_10995 [Elusimicrobia bacterium]|nr:hypothetical protein [Elusimicrobiota bacterium]
MSECYDKYAVCPHCAQPRNPSSPDCPSCGLVFHKWKEYRVGQLRRFAQESIEDKQRADRLLPMGLPAAAFALWFTLLVTLGSHIRF